MKIGYIYEDKKQIYIGNGRIICEKDIILITNKRVYDECDLHYFRKNPKFIESNEKVKVVGYWMNFYGHFIRCVYNNETYDIPLNDLNYE